MSLFAKICSREIFEILSFAKISSREMTKKFIRENKFLRKLIPLRYFKSSNARRATRKTDRFTWYAVRATRPERVKKSCYPRISETSTELWIKEYCFH